MHSQTTDETGAIDVLLDTILKGNERYCHWASSEIWFFYRLSFKSLPSNLSTCFPIFLAYIITELCDHDDGINILMGNDALWQKLQHTNVFLCCIFFFFFVKKSIV